jgi:CO/xanthine dehydrogenase FAD-binding subunit
LLCRAAEQTGGVATQNRGTIGGNIANASPAADTPPALLVYDAELELISARGTRSVFYHQFHSGYKVMDLKDDEIIKSITLPRGRHSWIQTYRKVGTRRAQAISKVCFAAAADLEGVVVRDVRIALGSVAPAVVRCRGAESALRGRALDETLAAGASVALADDIAPIDDIRSTARYRLHVARNLLIEFVTELLSRRTH